MLSEALRLGREVSELKFGSPPNLRRTECAVAVALCDGSHCGVGAGAGRGG